MNDEVWKLIDEQNSLRNEIETSFGEYDFVIELDEYIEFFRIGMRNIEELSGKLKSDVISQENVKQCYIENKFSVFSLMSLHLSFENYIYHSTKELDLLHTHIELDKWKKNGACNVFKSGRNRAQHGALIEGTFNYEFRSASHPKGAGVEARFEVFNSEWEKIINGANDIGKEYFRNILSKSNDPLKLLFTSYQTETQSIVEYLKAEFRTKFKVQLEQREEMFLKIEHIETRLKELDVYSAFNLLHQNSGLDD